MIVFVHNLSSVFTRRISYMKLLIATIDFQTSLAAFVYDIMYNVRIKYDSRCKFIHVREENNNNFVQY